MKHFLLASVVALLGLGALVLTLNLLQTAPEDALVTDDQWHTVDESDYIDAEALLLAVPENELTAAEAAGLQFMREEEKLARDVYVALYDLWGANIFNNIAASERTHMEAVAVLLARYNLTDPALAAYGEFSNQELQSLYDELVAAGSQSLTAAYQVGALIEDLDIKDLATYLAQTDNEDIRLVYENLQRGSRNHLRAFNRQLVRATGQNYVPQHISERMFADIISSDTERGPRGGRNQTWQE